MRKALLIVLLAAGIFMLNPGTSMAVPVYNSANGHSYDIVTDWSGSWDTANDLVALNSDWTLATITDADEQAFIQNMIIGNNTGEFWLGGYQTPGTAVASANWNWVTGEAWDYTHWNGGEPNDYSGPGSEQFLAIWGSGTWAWNDEGAIGNITGFIVETAPVPEPATLLLLGSGLLGLAGFIRNFKK